MPIALLALTISAFASICGAAGRALHAARRRRGLRPEHRRLQSRHRGGAWGGGVIVERLGLVHTGWIGEIVVLGAYALTALGGRLDQRNPRAVDPNEQKSIHVAAH